MNRDAAAFGNPLSGSAQAYKQTMEDRLKALTEESDQLKKELDLVPDSANGEPGYIYVGDAGNGKWFWSMRMDANVEIRSSAVYGSEAAARADAEIYRMNHLNEAPAPRFLLPYERVVAETGETFFYLLLGERRA